MYAWRAHATRLLVKAVMTGDETRVSRYLRLWADPNAAEPSGVVALTQAAADGRIGIVRALVSAGADVNHAASEGGTTALMYAAFWGYDGVVEALLAAGANIDQGDHSGGTALFDAVRGKNPDMVKFLLKKGANGAVRNSEGHTPLWLAARRGNDPAVVYLIESQNYPSTAEEWSILAAIALEHGHTNTSHLIQEIQKEKAVH